MAAAPGGGALVLQADDVMQSMQGSAGQPAATKQASKKRQHEAQGTASHKATVPARQLL